MCLAYSVRPRTNKLLKLLTTMADVPSLDDKVTSGSINLTGFCLSTGPGKRGNGLRDGSPHKESHPR